MSEARTERRMPDWVPWLAIAIVAGVLLTIALVNLVTAISDVLSMMVSALFLSLALEPAVNFLARRGWRRGAATGAVMFAIVVVSVAFFVMIVPTFVRELAGLVGQIPELIAGAANELGFDVSTGNLQQSLTESSENLKQAAATLAGGAISFTGWVLGLAGSIAAVGLLAFYLTTDAPRVRATVCSFLPERRQLEVLKLWEIAIDKVGAYLYSRLLMGTLSGFTTYILLRILGVPFAAPLAIFEGFVSQFVPIIGTYIAYAAPIVVALATKGLGTALILLAFSLLYQALENFLISPLISAKTMELHPAVAYVAALIGAAIGGALGAFVALPVAAIIQAFSSTFWSRHQVVSSDLTKQVSPEDAKAEWQRVKAEKAADGTWLERVRKRSQELRRQSRD